MYVDAEFDPAAYFDRWLADVAAAGSQPAVELVFHRRPLDQDIYVESRIGSNCELNFEGVLHFDGYSLGNVAFAKRHTGIDQARPDRGGYRCGHGDN